MMSKAKAVLFLIVLAVTVFPLFGAAQDTGVRFRPHVLPVELGWSAKDGLSVSFKGLDVPTPLGTLSVDMSLSQADAAFPNTNLLVIVIAGKSHIYDLCGESFVLELPNNVQGRVTLEYDGDNIFLRIPHPDVLKAPKRIDQDAQNTLATIQEGSFALRTGQSYSFELRKVIDSYSGDLTLTGSSISAGFHAYGILDMGSVAINSVRTVPKGPRLAMSVLRFAMPRGKLHYIDSSFGIHPGHTYAVKLGPNGPFALIQPTNLRELNVMEVQVTCRYRYQKDGSTSFPTGRD